MIETSLKILIPLISILFGYWVGRIRSFREQKQKIYLELLPPILQMGYDPKSANEEEFSRALSKLWLYGSKDVTKKMERAVSILHKPSRGNLTEAFQNAVVSMRNDLQVWPWQKIEPKDVNHLYTKIIGKKQNST